MEKIIATRRYVPSKIYSKEQFEDFVARFKSFSREHDFCKGEEEKEDERRSDFPKSDSVVSVATKLNYYGRQFFTFVPPSLWNNGYVMCALYFLANDEKLSKQMGNSTSNEEDGTNMKHFKSFQKTCCLIGTLKEIFQSGHSYLQNILTPPLDRTFRAYITAGENLDRFTLKIPKRIAEELLGINVHYTTGMGANADDSSSATAIDLPFHVRIIIKRDPVIWEGGVHLIRRIIPTEESSCGISPLILKALNGDIDGDTIVGVVCLGLESSLELEKNLSSVQVCRQLRASFSQSHVLAIFLMLLRSKYGDELDPDWAPSYEDFDRLVGKDASSEKVFGEWHGYFDMIRKHMDRIGNFSSMLDEMCKLIDDCDTKDYFEAFEDKRVEERNVDRFMNFMVSRCISSLPLAPGTVPDCLLNRSVVYCGIKGKKETVERMQRSFENFLSETSTPQTTSYDDDDDDNDDDNSLISKMGFFSSVRKEVKEEYLHYLDDFVSGGQSVPRASYEASNFLAILQFIKNNNDSLLFNDVEFLKNVPWSPDLCLNECAVSILAADETTWRK